MHRLGLSLAASLITTLALAWYAEGGRICRLTHVELGAAVELTYDPAGPIYMITIARQNEDWPPRLFSVSLSTARKA